MLYYRSLYNFAFFGHWREKCEPLDGHFAFITDLKEFVFYKTADYGGFQWVNDNFQVPDLSESQYRYVHDAILANKSDRHVRTDQDPEITKLWETLKHYPLQNYKISANIGYGDNITHLGTGETFTVDHGHDLRYLNKNHHWKLIDRELHPNKATLAEFTEKLNSIDPFKGWEKVTRPKKLYQGHGKLIINGQTYILESDMNSNRYYITTPDKITYSIHSHISAPFYNTIDLLTGQVYSEYQSLEGKRFEHCIHDCQNIDTELTPTRYCKFIEPESYHYNTRMTDF